MNICFIKVAYTDNTRCLCLSAQGFYSSSQLDTQTCLELSCRCPWAQTCLLLFWFVGFLGRPCTYDVGSLVSSHASCLSWRDPWIQLGLDLLPHLVWDCRWTLSLSPPCADASSGSALPPLPVPYLLSATGSSSLTDQLASCSSLAQTCTLGVFKNCKPQISIFSHHLAFISMKFKHKYCYVSQQLVKSRERRGFTSKQVFRCD